MPEIASDDNFTIHPQLNNLLRVLTICKGFALYFGSCNTVELRESLVVSLKGKLHRPIIELLLDPHNQSAIVEQAEHLMVSADESAVLFIYGLEKLHYLKERYVMQELQWHRERYGQLKCPIVFWMPDFLITKIFHQAPDFMDWRSGIYEFALSKPEKIQLMESTWQRANENFVEQLTIEEKERWIVSIKNLLLELGGDENNKTKANLLNRLGLLHDSLGQFDKALGCYRENLALQQLSGDKQGEGATLNNISQIYKVKGDYATALRYLQNSLKIRQEIGDIAGMCATLFNMGHIHLENDEPQEAVGKWVAAYQIAKKIGLAQALDALDSLAKQLGGDGLAFWEQFTE